MKELSVEQKAKAYDEAIRKAKDILNYKEIRQEDVEYLFPELKESDESEDEKIRKELIDFVKSRLAGFPQCEKFIAWLEKQGEHNSADKVEPKFNEGDWVVRGKTIAQILDIQEQYYIGLDINGNDFTSSRFLNDNKIHLWTINDAKDGDVLASEDKVFIYNGKFDLRGRICAYCGIYKTYDGLRFTECAIGNYFTYKEPHPATKEQRDTLMKAMTDAGYTFDFEKRELKKIGQKHAKWEPQTGDAFRKKGTTSPTYHLCNKREDGITFVFVENREVGISGGEITIFALRQGYELVERPKSIEDVVEKELNKSLQTKVEQKADWSDEDLYKIEHALFGTYAVDSATRLLNKIKSLRHQWKPSEEQMEALESATENCAYSEYQDCLKELIKQLKQL